MFERINIKGFKCFIDNVFDLEPLTVLSGLNSSGKSSLLQAIRAIWKQSSLDGHGSLSEFVSVHSNGFELSSTVKGGYINFSYFDGFLLGKNSIDKSKNLLSSINASRFGPKPYLPLWTKQDPPELGEYAEYVLDFLGRHEELSGLPALLTHPNSNSSSVRLNSAAWLNLISPGVNFDFSVNQKADIGSAEYSGRRPTNVGFGLSYTLPIIVNVLVYAALLSNNHIDSATILLENPEAHLHPSGQTQLGEFLARASQCGVQIITETHSDHLLNGIRLAVKDNVLPADNTAFYYFEYNFKEEFSSVHRPVIDNHGMFDEWPSGFFDETEKSLGKLL